MLTTATTPSAGSGSTGVPFVRLQRQPGLHGVTKLQWRDWPSRTWLSWVSAGVYLAVAGGVAVLTHHTPTHASWYGTARAIVTGAWVLLVISRLVMEGTVSKPLPGQPGHWDKQLVDPWWTTIHTLTGVVLGLWLVPLVVVVLCTIGWECVEISVPGFGDEEINGNRLTDVSVAWGGWLLALLVSGAAGAWTLPLV